MLEDTVVHNIIWEIFTDTYYLFSAGRHSCPQYYLRHIYSFILSIPMIYLVLEDIDVHIYYLRHIYSYILSLLIIYIVLGDIYWWTNLSSHAYEFYLHTVGYFLLWVYIQVSDFNLFHIVLEKYQLKNLVNICYQYSHCSNTSISLNCN